MIVVVFDQADMTISRKAMEKQVEENEKPIAIKIG
jgi:hypothetical protein